MGKAEEEQNLAASVAYEADVQVNVEPRFAGFGCGWIHKLVGFKCCLLLLLSLSVFLSALFWLPPFAYHNRLDLDSKFKDHDIVASFNVDKPVSILEDNFLQLEYDIFNEIGVPTTKVVILSLETLAGLNITEVVFAVDPDAKNTKISLPSQSLIRSSFVSLVTKQTFLRLTTSLFGDPFFFEVLKFPGGITVIPTQSAFLLQKVQILFNFTLNFSIYQIQENFNELTIQLKLGLHLTPYENLYISLSNSRGSTVAPPTIVQSSVLLAIGNTPSVPRLKQLAQTITGSHSKNLGLNNTVFGRVKQVRLSSILQHSLHGGDNGATSLSPSPAPLPHPHHHQHHRHQNHHQQHHRHRRHHHHHHHRHHHHHHHHHHTDHLAPAPSQMPATQKGAPAPVHGSPDHSKISPAPQKSYEAKPPGCRSGNKKGPTEKAKHTHLAPTVTPISSPHYSAASPQERTAPPTHMPAPVTWSIPASSPLPNVVFAHARPPSTYGADGGNSDTTTSVSSSPSSSCAGRTTVQLAFSLLLAIVLQLSQQW